MLENTGKFSPLFIRDIPVLHPAALYPVNSNCSSSSKCFPGFPHLFGLHVGMYHTIPRFLREDTLLQTRVLKWHLPVFINHLFRYEAFALVFFLS